MEIQANFIALGIVCLAQFILGMVWYGPLFGTTWMEIMGMEKMSKSEMQKAQQAMMPYYLLQLLLTVVSNFFLMFFVRSITSVAPHVVGLMLYVGFVAPMVIQGVIWGTTKKKHWFKQVLIALSYQLVCIVVASWAFGLWS